MTKDGTDLSTLLSILSLWKPPLHTHSYFPSVLLHAVSEVAEQSLLISIGFSSGSTSSEQYISFYSFHKHYLYSRCLCGWSNQQDIYSQSCLECWCSWRVVHKDVGHTRWRHHHRCFRASQRDSCTCHWRGHRTWCGLCYRCSLTDSPSRTWRLSIL